AESLEVAENGNLFARNAQGQSYAWTGTGWSLLTTQTSPDGTTLLAGSGGSVVTGDGVWSFGASSAGAPGFAILLNGLSAAGGAAVSLEVAQDGHLFADNAQGQWYEWFGTGWGAVTHPAGSLTTSASLTQFGVPATASGLAPPLLHV